MSTRIVHGNALDVLKGLPAGSVRCCVTSPPYYGLRDYGVPGQLGLERTPELYVSRMVEVFAEVRRILTPDGTLWLNLGDSYATGVGQAGDCGTGYRGINTTDPKSRHGLVPIRQPNRMGLPGLKPKDLIGIPWRVAFGLQADGWYLRSDIIWQKPNCMPSSVKDRPTSSHEYIFLLAKSRKYFYDADAIREPHKTQGRKPGNKSRVYVDRDPVHLASGKKRPSDDCCFHPKGRNKRTVWTVATTPFKGAHFATFPEKLIEPCILAGSAVGDVVLDPFAGSGTTLAVASRLGRSGVGVEIQRKYIPLVSKRLAA